MTISNQIISIKLSGINYSGSATQLNYTAGVTGGVAEASKALILDANKQLSGIDILNVNVLNATSISGLLTTAAQPNITSLGTLPNLIVSTKLNITGHNGSTNGLFLGNNLVKSTANQLNYNTVSTPGIAEASKTLVLDSTRDIENINYIGAETIQIDTLVLGESIVNVSATKLNYNNINTIGIAEASKTLVLDASKNISNINNLGLNNELNITKSNSGNPINITTGTSIFSITHNLNSNILIGSKTNNHIGLVTNNVERLRILNTGNVGITTTTPFSKLDLGNTTSNYILSLYNNTTDFFGYGVSETILYNYTKSSYNWYNNSTKTSQGNLLMSLSSSNLELLTDLKANNVTLKSVIIEGDINIYGNYKINGNSLDLALLGYFTEITPGTASPYKSLILNELKNISGINSLNATSLNATNIYGNIMTGSQPNITSIGTLSSLNVSGTISGVTTLGMSGNLTTSGTVIANSFSGLITTSSQPNITSIGTLSSLNITNSLKLNTTISTHNININSSVGNILYAQRNSNVNQYLNMYIDTTGNTHLETYSNSFIYMKSNSIVVGNSDTNDNNIYFLGKSGDNTYNHTVISERLYKYTELNAKVSDNSELFLFKGDDTSNSTGPDRIRLRSGEIRFQIFTETEVFSDLKDNNNVLVIANTKNILIGDTIDNSYKLNIKGSTKQLLSLSYLTKNAYFDVDSTGNLLLINDTNKVYIGDSINNNRDLIVGSNNATHSNGYLQFSIISGKNYIYHGLSSAANSIADLLIGPVGTTSISNNKGIILKADGTIGFGINEPVTKLDIKTINDWGIQLYNNVSNDTTTWGINSSGQSIFKLSKSTGYFSFLNDVYLNVKTAAQPNITSVGTLTSLSISGDITTVSNITLNNGNINNVKDINATNYYGIIKTAAQPNITSIGTITDFKASNSIKIGINSTSVDELLHIEKDSLTPIGILIENNNNSNGLKGHITFSSYKSATANYDIAKIEAYYNYQTTTYGYGELLFSTRGSSASSAASERMRISYNGNVGINTISPSYKLDVSGDINCTGRFRINGTVLGDTTLLTGVTEGVASSSKAVILNSTKEISGIYTLKLENNIRPLYMYNSSLNTNETISAVIGRANASHSQGELTYTHNLAGSNSIISLGHYGNPYILNVLSGKKIGINTKSPEYDLDVTGDIRGVNLRATNNIYATSNAYISTNTYCYGSMYCSNLNSYNNSDLDLYMGGVSKIKIKTTGNVGINNTNPVYNLDVSGDINCSGVIRINGTSIGDSSYLTGVTLGLVSASKALIVDSNKDLVGLRNVGLSNIKNGFTVTPSTVTNLGFNIDNFLFGTTGGRGFSSILLNNDTISMLSYSSGGTFSNYMSWHHNSGVPYLYIPSGKVGIKKTPTFDLDVNGSINSTNLYINGFILNSSANELNYLNGISIGNASASKALVTNSSKDISGINNLTTTTLYTTSFYLNGSQVTATSGELNYLDIGSAGTAEASKALVLNSARSISNIGDIASTGTISASYFDFGNYIRTNSTTSAIVQTSSLEAYNVQIKKNTTITNDTTGIGFLITTSSFSTVPGASIINYRTGSGGIGDLAFGTRSDNTICSEKMRILSNGNVGIGTSSPSVKLSLGASANNIILALYNDDNAGSDFYGFGANSGTTMYHGKSYHRWYMGTTDNSLGTTAMTLSNSELSVTGKITASDYIKTDKYLQIGNTTDTTRLISALTGTSGTSYIAFGAYNNLGNQAELSFIYNSSNSSSNTLRLGFHGNAEVVTIQHGKKVGINNSSPSETLDVNGSFAANSIKLGGGSTFSKMIARNYTIGTTSGTYVTITVNHGQSTAPNMAFSNIIKNSSNSDEMGSCVNNLSATTADIGIWRSDSTGWGATTMVVSVLFIWVSEF